MRESRFEIKRYAPQVLAVAAAYAAAGRLGLSLAVVNKQVTAVWPPSGIALAAVILLGYRAWPGIALGAFLVNAHAGSAATACGIAAGNTLEALAGAFLLRRLGFEPSLERLRDILGLVLFAAMLSTALSATIGVASLQLGGVPGAAFRSMWSVWWLGDAMGILVVTPLLLTWARPPRVPWRGRKLAELALLLGSLILIGNALLSRHFIAPSYPLRSLVFPFLIWTAVRFSQREVAAVNALVSGLTLWGALHEAGPGGLEESVNLAQLFVAMFALTALVLGAMTAERKKADAELRQARDTLEARVAKRTADLAKTNEELTRKKEDLEGFVHTISHDLRGPLVNIRGFARELKQAGGEKARDETIRFIDASAERMQRLLDALLGFSRLGRRDYRFQDLDVDVLVGATLDSLSRCLEEKQARVEKSALPRAYGDQTAVAQIFSNLLQNAVNFLRPGRPGLIEIGGDTREGMSHYWVKDNGLGIPEAAKPRLFRVFQRFHPAVAPGEGIGLAAVKQLVERHGGRVWAESREGTGSTFHLTLPEARYTVSSTGETS